LHIKKQQDGTECKDFSEIEKLVNQYEDMLYNLCCHLTRCIDDAQDLYQQTWLKAIEKINDIKIHSMKNWLYTVCLNLYRDSYNKRKRGAKVFINHLSEKSKELAFENATENITAEDLVIKNSQREILINNIEQLSDKLRLPIILYYFDGLEYNEIAQVLHIPMGTVKSRLSLAKSKLRKEMESELNV
jgi:RNA polymerase sigma-70 factor (ECF subfamily)